MTCLSRKTPPPVPSWNFSVSIPITESHTSVHKWSASIQSWKSKNKSFKMRFISYRKVSWCNLFHVLKWVFLVNKYIQYTPNLGTTSLETTPWVPVQELSPGVCVLTEAAPSGPAQLLPHQGFLLTLLKSHISSSHLASTDSRNCSKLHSVSLHQSQSPLPSIPPLGLS